MDTKQIKERINRMMREETLSPDQAVELMASVMSLIEVRALADDLTAAVVDKALAEIGEGKLEAEKAVELFDELRAMAEREESDKAQKKEKDEPASSGKKVYTGDDLGGMIRDVTGEALEYARDQIEIARDKLDKQGEKIRRRMKDNGIGRTDGDVVQDHYTVSAHSAISGDLKTKCTSVHGVLTLGGDLQAMDSLKVSGKLDCGGDIESGDTHIHGSCDCSGDMRTKDLKALGRLRCGGDMMCRDISVHGAVDCDGDAALEDMSVSGRFKSGGDIHAKEIKVSGRLISGGDMAASDIHLSGKITCGGDLTAGTVHVSGRLIGGGDMHVDSLTVDEPREWVEWLTGGLIKNVDQVECNGNLTVDGEVRARGRIVVKGRASFDKGAVEYLSARSVSLGPGVKAKRVEYKDALDLAEGAEVEDPVQVS